MLAYDLAIALNDWCALPDGDIDGERARHAGRLSVGAPAQRRRKAAWPVLLRAAGLRFWTSRLYDKYLPQAGELTFTKDPAQFQRVVALHRQRQDFWL